MTVARKKLVNPSVTRWYHCISRCVRQAFLIGENGCQRKVWIENRLRLLARNFAISVGGYCVMNNHLHVLCRLDPAISNSWSAIEIIRRWVNVYPPKDFRKLEENEREAWIREQASDHSRVEELRVRLSDLGWFMKSLKEPLARLANKEDGCKGTFWEGRYKSIAVLDKDALMATNVYIDLNPVASGSADTPESSKFTSISQRIQHVRIKGKIRNLKAAKQGTVNGSVSLGNVEEDHWLVPIEDRRCISKNPSVREGMVKTFSIGSYLALVDYTSRLMRKGKARIDKNLEDIFTRLELNQAYWDKWVSKITNCVRFRGNVFAFPGNLGRKSQSIRIQRRHNLCPQVSQS